MDTIRLLTYPIAITTDPRYDHYLGLFPENPSYRRELLLPRRNQDGELFYFIMLREETTLAIMPLLLRKIVLNEADTGYHDVISPYGYSGPLFQKNSTEEVIAHFWKLVDQWYSENKVISEFIRFNMDKNWLGYSGKLQPTLSNVCGIILPEEVQWQNFKPKVRNNFRKAGKAGLIANVHHNRITNENISHFYQIYRETMQRKNASSQYLYDLEYFTNFINKNLDCCALAMVYKDGIPISTELLLLSEDNVYSFLGGTDADYFVYRPNDLLKITVLNWAREKGYKKYFLGGGRSDNDSLYKYKKDFFPKDNDVIFYTGRKVLDKEAYNRLVKETRSDLLANRANYFPLYRLLPTT